MRHLIIADGLLALLLALALVWLWAEAQPMRLTVEEYAEWMCIHRDSHTLAPMPHPDLTWTDVQLMFHASVKALDSIEPPAEVREFHFLVRNQGAGMRDFADSYEATSIDAGINAMILDMQAYPERYGGWWGRRSTEPELLLQLVVCE